MLVTMEVLSSDVAMGAVSATPALKDSTGRLPAPSPMLAAAAVWLSSVQWQAVTPPAKGCVGNRVMGRPEVAHTGSAMAVPPKVELPGM